MAGRIPQSFIEDLAARTDIVSVIGRRIELKRSGNSYKACCPFHHEKTPSFHVNVQKNYYHCFGCGVHGDALRFVMEYEHLSFVDAVEQLATELGVDVPREVLSKDQQNVVAAQTKASRSAYELLAQVAAWYVNELKQGVEREMVIEYLKSRGLSGEVARDLGLGYAPTTARHLLNAFPDVDSEAWQSVGLLVEREDGRLVERFRGRVQFPIRDVKGRVVGFGGRLIRSSDKSPKYLNSPETSFFHKSQILYGLHELLRHVRQVTSILVVEGYMDVLALAQHGIRHVVATLGTATAEAHLTLLFKYTDDVVFAFDGDKAGRQAAWKALPIALALLTGRRGVKFYFLPEGEDPDSLVRQQGKEAFLQGLTTALSPGEWLVQGLSVQTGWRWQEEDEVRRLLSQAVEWVKLAVDRNVQYTLIQSLAKASAMQEWQVEKTLGVKTGLAVNRVAMKQGVKSDVPMESGVSYTLTRRLLALLNLHADLAQSWPKAEEALLRQYGGRGMSHLLAVVMQVEPSEVVVSEEMAGFSVDQAQVEWESGWRRLVCQSLQNAQRDLLNLMQADPRNDGLKDRVRDVSERVRHCLKNKLPSGG